MSKEFYNYIVNKTIDYFNSTALKTGERYILKLDSETDVVNYYEAMDRILTEKGIKSVYEYKVKGIFETDAFETSSGIKLAIIPEIKITNAYLTTLRNSVLQGFAILIVCHNPIDSISSGTENLQREGMPFHKIELTKAITKNIENSELILAEKEVLKYELKNINDNSYLESYSLNDYSNILAVIEKEKIEDNDFYNFSLFPDKELNTLSLVPIGDIKNRIDDNNKYFKKIDISVKFGDPDKDLFKDFSDSFIKKVKNNSHSISKKWYDNITFEEVNKALDKGNQKNKPIEVIEISVFADGVKLKNNIDFYICSEAETGVKKNRRNILIFNKNGAEHIEIVPTLSDFPSKNENKVYDKNISSAEVKGKKFIISVKHKDISIDRVDLKCKERKVNFQFSYCIINCSKMWFESIAANFSISAKPRKDTLKGLVINCDFEQIKFNHQKEDGETAHLEPNIEIAYNGDKYFILEIDENSFDDNNEANVLLSINDNKLPVIFKEILPANVSISGIRILQQKLKTRQSFTYWENNRLMLGTSKFNTREDLRINLLIEEYILKSKCLSCCFYDVDNMQDEKIDVSEEVSLAYYDLVDYFISKNTLPSLAYFDEELTKLSERYLKCILNEFDNIKNNAPLNKKQENLMKIGLVYFHVEEIIAFSPLHPINIAYQIQLNTVLKNSKSEIREDILKKFCSDNLIPFIHNANGNLYKVYEQNHSPQWTYYAPADQKKYKGTRDFVSDLVCKKIEDFREHFQYLFNCIGSNQIIVNAVNMGDCRNLFKGIVEYYKSALSKDDTKFLSIIVNVYNDSKIYNVFEALSNKFMLKTLLSEFGIKEENRKFSESEFINCIITNVKYYRKNIADEKYSYCHLSFIEMDNETKEGYSNKNDIRSATMLNGLLSGVTSMYYGENGSYRTGYGSKFNNSDNTLLQLTDIYNTIMLVYGKGNSYNENSVICTAIDEKETSIIEKTYDSSNWVVFIDPKVDLNFFKSEDKDIMIIHYSDQHTTSSGYDAITVTKKTEQYANILNEFLSQNSLPAGDYKHIRKMIDMFNAVNGDWLLKLLSSKESFRKEKISIQSAIKLAMAFYKNDDIIWIPISLEEILRVSGSVGLAQKDGLFTAKNLGYDHGATSDDLLMFGVEKKNEQVYVHLYPLEVKIGYKNSNETEKASKQIKQTRKILDNNLSNQENDDDLQVIFYRNFIAQLAVISAEKLNLYNIWEGQDWERIVNTNIRSKLLNNEFTISNSLHETIGDGIIISFKEGSYMRSVIKDNDITVIKFLYSDGINYITKTVDEIFDDIKLMPDVLKHIIQADVLENEIEEIENEVAASVEENILLENSENINIEGKNINDNDLVSSPNGMQIIFGHDVNLGNPLYWFPNDTEKIMHPNTGIIGTMGTGKTQFTKSLILQLMREQQNNPGNKHLGILIFDYKGDYNKNKIDFVEATGAKVYDLYHLPINPFSITVTPNSKKMLPIHIASTFCDTISKSFGLGVKQERTLLNCIMQAYRLKGIDKNDEGTWNRIAPALKDVFNIYVNSEAFSEDSLYSALSKLNDFEIFETNSTKTKPLYKIIDGVTVIDLSGYDPSIQNLVVAITLDLFYSQMQSYGHSQIHGKLRQLTKFILVDEADNFLKVGFSSLKKILKEGREFGVGTILSTQFLKHFNTQDDDFTKYIFSWIVHNVADFSTKELKAIFNTISKTQEEELFADIKRLAKHHSFVKFGDSSGPSYIKDCAFWEILKEEGRDD